MMSVTEHILQTCMGLNVSNRQQGRKKSSLSNRSLEQQAIVIADYIHKRQVLGQKESPPDQICETMAFIVDEFLNGNSKTLSAITEVLEGPRADEKSDEEVITKIFDSMFADGKINWGRIGATYAFGVKFCLREISKDINGNKKQLPDERTLRFVGEYVGEKLGPWIRKEGGWESIIGLFPNKEVVVQQLRSAGFLFLTVGVGSLLNVLAS